MSDAADQARELLADPPIGVEVWGPIVEGLLGELEGLHTWNGLMSLADEHYPTYIFPHLAGHPDDPDRDPGPRILSLIREVDRLRAADVDLAKARNVIEQVRPALESIANVLAFSARDWGQARDLAWLWGIVHGWDDEDHEEDSAMPEQARVHGWDDAEVARLRRLHGALARILDEAERGEGS